MERKHQTLTTIKAEAEVFGKEILLEESNQMSIEQMYQRMLAMGEIQNGMRQKVGTTNKQQAEALIMAAKKPPLYMREGELKDITEQILNAQDEIKKTNNQKEIENWKNQIIKDFKNSNEFKTEIENELIRNYSNYQN